MSEGMPSPSRAVLESRAVALGPDFAAELALYLQRDEASLALDIAAAAADRESLVALAEIFQSPRELDVQRTHALRGLELDPRARVLELGCGWGTLTRYLAETCAAVDALAPETADAVMAAARVQDMDNARVYLGRIDDLPPGGYDLVVVSDFGSIGWSARDLESVGEQLSRVLTRLAPDGTLVLLADNRRGVKYLAGGTEREAIGHETASDEDRFTLEALTSLLEGVELAPRFYPVFPDLWAPRVVMDAAALAESAPALVTALPGFPSPDGRGAPPRALDEGALWSDWLADGSFERVANSFVVVASRTVTADLWPSGRLATYWSLGRSSTQSAENAVVLRMDHSVGIERRRLPSETIVPTSPVSFTPSDDDYVVGTSLVSAIAEASDLSAVSGLLRGWLDLIDLRASTDLPVLWDLVPHNVIVSDLGYTAIDQEWILEGVDWAPVVRRGVFWLASRIAEAGVVPSWYTGVTIADAAVDLGTTVGLDPDGAWLDMFYAEEARAVASTLRPDPQLTAAERIPALSEQLVRSGGATWRSVARNPMLAERFFELERTRDGNTTMAPDHTIGRSTGTGVAELLARDARLAAKDAEIAALSARVGDLESSVEGLRVNERHTALLHRDYVIGLQAELATVRSELREARKTGAARRARLASLRDEVVGLRKDLRAKEKQLQQLRSSTTWRAGRILTKPLALFRRR